MKWIAIFAASVLVFAQAPANPEEDNLRRVLAETGNSPIEFIRALEGHLKMFPGTNQRAELERAILKSAYETKDNARIVAYGTSVLGRDNENVEALERVTRALLIGDGKDAASKALGYAKQFEKVVRALDRAERGKSARMRWQVRYELDQGLGRALVFQARALGNLGDFASAAAAAEKSFDAFPNGESARECGKWLAKLGRQEDAVKRYAESFAMSDPRIPESDRAKTRETAGEIYKAWKGSEAGLGDYFLQAYDRVSKLLETRLARLREGDPNAQVTDPIEYTVSAMSGEALKLASLKGKVILLDFWATWCGPCRGQHPVYEKIKEKYRERKDIVFLSINTDEDKTLVAPFLKQLSWTNSVYFEDGLSRLLNVTQIPSTIVFSKKGEIGGRINGFIAERFESQLVERIDALLAE